MENVTPIDAAVDDFDLLENAEVILAVEDVKEEVVRVPEWGAKKAVRVRRLSSTDRDAFEKSITKEIQDPENPKKTKVERDMANWRAKVAALGIVNAHGARVFSAEHVLRLGEKSSAPINRIAETVMRLSGMTEEELEKKAEPSAPAPSDGSSSD